MYQYELHTSSLQSARATSGLETLRTGPTSGCRGFAGHSLQRVLRLGGVRGLQSRKAPKNILEAAERNLPLVVGDPRGAGGLIKDLKLPTTLLQNLLWLVFEMFLSKGQFVDCSVIEMFHSNVIIGNSSDLLIKLTGWQKWGDTGRTSTVSLFVFSPHSSKGSRCSWCSHCSVPARAGNQLADWQKSCEATST